MESLARFVERGAAGVRWLDAAALPPGLEKLASQARLTLRRIDAGRFRRKNEFLDGFARALQFPSYFGRNWDALEDCLTDLNWFGEEGLLIAIEGADRFLRAEPTDWEMLIDILDATSAHWAKVGRPVLFLLQGKGRPGRIEEVSP